MKYVLIALLWSGYCALHSYLISIRFTNLMSRLLKSYYAFYRLFYVLISFVLLVPLIRYSAQIDSTIIINWGSTFTIIRYILTSSSLLLFFWAFFFDYDSLSFFGIRQIINSVQKKENQRVEGN